MFPCKRRFPTIPPLARSMVRIAGQCGTFVSRPERCRSGRTGLTRNQLSLPGDRGFESLPLRHLSNNYNKLQKSYHKSYHKSEKIG